jgi:ribose transport system permease protein
MRPGMDQEAKHVVPEDPASPVAQSAATGSKTIAAARRVLRHPQFGSVIPLYAVIFVLIVASRGINANLGGIGELKTVLMLAVVTAVISLGQGLVIMTGGIDLSLPWSMTLTAVLVSGISAGTNLGLVKAVPIGLAAGAAIGLVNGFGVVALKVSPVVMTLAMNIIIRGAVLVKTNGTPPPSYIAPALSNMAIGRVIGIPTIIVFLVIFTIIACLLYSRTKYGRRVRAIGNNPLVAKMSGLNVGPNVIGVYVIAGVCSAIGGMILGAQSGMAYLGMGDAYLLPSIAAVVLGGGSILGGKGHFIGTLGGAILLSAISVILVALSLNVAWRQIVFGVVVLGAMWITADRGSN